MLKSKKKDEICHQIKNISYNKVLTEWNNIRDLLGSQKELNGRSKLGCNFLDYYFFSHRLDTIGNKGINFYDFLENIEYYKTKKYIQTLLTFCHENNRYVGKEIKKYYYIYGLCFGRCNAFKITNALEFYQKYKPAHILDPFCGFGGRLVAAMLLGVNYTGIDLNVDLKTGYDKLLTDFQSKTSSEVSLIYQDSKEVDYTKFTYDMVFTSPPYENIEIYKNGEKKTNNEWNKFYQIVFQNTWKSLSPGGIYAININAAIYEKSLVPLLGACHEKSELKKSTRNTKYKEYIYIWAKPA
jgi:DNA modification methylase